ncbi:4-hydroxy-3-methylbut-2-enyl diphosphate reductase [soil metagenome]
MKSFDIPIFYRSPVISRIKNLRKKGDPRKQDYTPTILDFGQVQFLIARHFGFCYGVENAIEISYRAIEENPDKRIFLLSEMIHNPDVNNDLQKRGVKFLMETTGHQIIDWTELTSDDIVIVPAFGTTLEIETKLSERGIDPLKYNTTCPFVEKVWNRAETLGKSDYTIVLHGKFRHEETKATFSHSKENAPTLIVKDINEAKILGDFISGKLSVEDFNNFFKANMSVGFDAEKDLNRIGVVNQTTMLATETQEIADYLRQSMIERYSEENIKEHFADTRDTLCYATHDNQRATYGLLNEQADIAIVVGGYNSSNTSHIVELCEEKLPTYFISDSTKITKDVIKHYDLHACNEIETNNYLPSKHPVRIILTSGASCPDSIVDDILQKIVSFYGVENNISEVLNKIEISNN